MSNLFYRNPRLVALAIGLILVAGLTALQSLGRQEDPALARRYGTVTTYFPGASAARVESLITEKLEAALQELHEIKKLESLSRSGASVIEIEFLDRFREEDVDQIWSKVRDRLADVGPQLPDGATTPELEERTTTAATLVAALVWDREDEPQVDLLTRLAFELENRLRNVAGTRETHLYGRAEEEIRVTVDPIALAGVELTAAEVARAIEQADAKVPAGQMRHGDHDLLIEVAGELASVDRIRRIPLRDSEVGRTLRVGDIADVRKVVVDPPRRLAWVSGRRGVVVDAVMEPDRRVDRWAQDAQEVVERFRDDVPRGVALEVIFDQSRYTDERLGKLAMNLLLGATIVLGVLFFMMGARSALIVASALPLASAMALGGLNLLGIPLHDTSVTGLIIALGLLIDNAIVIVDELNQQREKGESAAAAVSAAVSHLFVPLLASTVTTVLAFLPIALMPGGAGEFVGPIAIGVGLSIGSSFLLAMTVIPALAAYFGPRQLAGSLHWWQRGFSHPRLLVLYRRSLDWSLERPWRGVAVAAALPLAGFLAATTLPEQFFPSTDRNQFQVQVVLPSQSSIAETSEVALAARELIHDHPEVLDSHWFVGETAPRVFYAMYSNIEGVSSYAGAFVTTTSAKTTESLLPRLQRELTESFPQARIVALPFEQGPAFEAPIEVRLYGPDLEQLRSLGDQLRVLLAETEGVTYTTSKLLGGEPKLVLRADEVEASVSGLGLVEIADQLNHSLEGIVGGSVVEGTEEIPVRVRVGSEVRSDLSRLGEKRVLSSGSSGARLAGTPLAALGQFELVPHLAGISRRNGVRINAAQAFLEPYTLIAESLSDFERRLRASDFVLPAGYRLEFGGERAERSEGVSKLLAYALPLFVIIAGSIVLAFNSFRYAGIIFLVGFLSVGLALGGVWAFGHPLGFLAIVGVMGLVGLAINDSIVVLAALRHSSAASSGDLGATREVVVRASRHILATTFTTMGGFLPLILFGGRYWPPLATAVVGGVGGASILALYLVPSIFRTVALKKRRLERARPLAATGAANAAA